MGLKALLIAAGLVFASAGKYKAPLTVHLSPTTVYEGTTTVTQTEVSFTTVFPQETGVPSGSGNDGTCDDGDYDPDIYICRNNVLCPVINGEPLSVCGSACCSKFLYTCKDSDLQLLPLYEERIVLYSDNPKHSALHNQRVTTCSHEWRIGGTTCSSCPASFTNQCPPGNITVINSAQQNAMAVTVPGGQEFYLTGTWNVGVTTAHSASVPPGAPIRGFTAFEGGGFFYDVGGQLGSGWVACGGGPEWELKAGNETSEECVGVNLRVERFDGMGAWQYE